MLTEQRWTVGIMELRNAQRRRAMGATLQPGDNRLHNALQNFAVHRGPTSRAKACGLSAPHGVGFIGINVHFKAHVR